MEQVDVIEKYITIVLTVFDMLNVRFCNGSGAIKEEPPLDLHQMVVWNGGHILVKFELRTASISFSVKVSVPSL